MKKLITLSLVLASVLPLFAQDSTQAVKKSKKKDWSKLNLGNRPNDHFMLQLGYNAWSNKPDTISTKGIPRSLNVYFMFDFPFKTDPRFSVGIGIGVGTDNYYLDKMTVDIAGRTNNQLTFRRDSSNYFKKFKLATTYAEIPVELRWAANPENTNKSWKMAVGAKIGTMLSASTKGKNLMNSRGVVNSYTEKIKSRRYFNSTRLAVTGRVSKGVFGIYGMYQINQFVKDGAAAANSGLQDIRPFQIGLVISGL